MSNGIPENRIISQQTTQVPASSAQPISTAKASEAPESLFPTTKTESDNLDQLYVKRDNIKENNGQLKEDKAVDNQVLAETAQNINDLTTATAVLQEANETLKAQNIQLSNEIVASNNRIKQINTRICDIKAQIDKCSGFTGTLINGLKSLIGKGVDVDALRAEMAELEAEKNKLAQENRERMTQIIANGGQIAENCAEIELNDGYVQDLEAQEAATEADLSEVQEAIQQGAISLEDVEEKIKESVEKQNAPVEGSVANDGNNALTEAMGNEDNKGTKVQLSDKQVTGLATGFVDAATNGELTTDSVDNLYAAAQEQDPATGEFNAEALGPMYEASGFEPWEIESRLEIIDRAANYASMGIYIDAAMFETASAAKLDEMIEAAMVQDTIKTTGTMVIGKGAAITSKKEMKQNAEAVDNFISTYSALNSYYKANNVENLEVNAFLNLSGDKLNKINQGYVYGTSELQEMIGNAGSMMTTLKTAVSLDEAAGKSASIQFQESSSKAEGAIDEAEGRLGETEDTASIDEFRAEFLNLTSKFNNSDTDSAKQISIKAMETLYQRALNAENGVNKDPYKNNINIAA